MKIPRVSPKTFLRSFAVWTSIALLFAAYAFLEYLSYGMELSIRQTLTWELIGWYLWGLFTPMIFLFARRYPPQKFLLIQLLAAILFAVTHLLFHLGFFNIIQVLFFSPEDKTEIRPVSRMAWRMMVYSVIVLCWYAIEAQKRMRAEEKRVAELSVQLSNAQLQALKMQLHPHFLFNTLNVISELMHHDLRTADEMMVRLAGFLRLTLDPSNSQEVTLEKELEFLKHYLDIEQVRFKDRLKVKIRVEPETTHARVPYLLLQPVVENAIRHGIGRKAEGGTIEISAEKEEQSLLIYVQDDGNGILETESTIKSGVGLANTRSRLEKLYGDRFQLELSNLPGTGTSVRLTIPFIEERV